MKYSKLFLCCCLSATFLAACGRGSTTLGAADEPAVAVSKVDGPLASLGDAMDARQPRTGALLVAAAQQFDPVTGQTTDNPMSVYVTSSDDFGVASVELALNGTLMGTYAKDDDGQAFKNPFIFPAPRSGLSSVPIPGASSGLVASTLRALATDVNGQVSEAAVLEIQADGSRPDIGVSVGDGSAPFVGPTVLNVVTGDPETGISGLEVYLDGSAEPAELTTPTSFDTILEPGTHTMRVVAFNGVLVPNVVVRTIVVEEEVDLEPNPGPDPGPDPNPGPDNQDPVVSLLAAPQSGDAPLTVSFSASATDPDGDEVTYLYDFGDGDTIAGAPAASHTYTEAGSYTATVTVDDGKGGQASDSVSITVGDDDDGDDNDDGNNGGTTAPNITSFKASDTEISAGDDVILSWEVENASTVKISSDQGDLFDVTADEDDQFTVNPTETTTYTITADGSGDTAVKSVTVEVDGDDDSDDGDGNGDDDQPAVSIGGDEARTATVGEAQDLEASTSNLDDATFQWSVTSGAAANVSFGDSAAEDTTVTFKAADTYTLQLTAKDSAGNTASDSVTITVKADGDNGSGNDNGGVDAVNDSAKTARGKAVTIKVLTNDKPGVQALIIVAATTPKKGGTVEISRDSKSIVYTPPDGFSGEDTFRYTVRDEDGHSSSARVTVKVGS